MNVNNIKINERSESGENEVPEEIKLPNEVYNANWRDDVVDEAEDETKEVTSFEPYENEQDYQSKEIVTPEAENLIWAFDRAKKQEFGKKVLNLDVFKEVA